MRVVLDTNVLISGVFFGGLPGKIVDACVSGSLQIAVSDWPFGRLGTRAGAGVTQVREIAIAGGRKPHPGARYP